MSRGFSFGKQVRKFANAENESFSNLYGGLLIIIRRAYIFQTNKFYFSQVRNFLSVANVKFSSKQTSSISIIAKEILVYLQNNVNLILIYKDFYIRFFNNIPSWLDLNRILNKILVGP